MKIDVIHRNGTREIIVLTEPLVISRGDGMNRLACSTGMEHWFNEDGTYDGWGMAVGAGYSSPDGTLEGSPDAMDLIQRTEADREFPDSL